MPRRITEVPAELFVEHRGVCIYRVYQGDRVDQTPYEDVFSLDPHGWHVLHISHLSGADSVPTTDEGRRALLCDLIDRGRITTPLADPLPVPAPWDGIPDEDELCEHIMDSFTFVVSIELLGEHLRNKERRWVEANRILDEWKSHVLESSIRKAQPVTDAQRLAVQDRVLRVFKHVQAAVVASLNTLLGG